jgi:hypothetical protein
MGVCILAVVLSVTTHNRIEAQTNDEVILDFKEAKAKVVSHDREEKNKRFNYKGPAESKQLIREFPSGVENLPTIIHWWVGLPALPVEQAEAIVIGTVTNREANLSEDGTSIYTEYSVRIEQVFKDPSTTFRTGDTVAVVRNGGAVRFQSGKIQKYSLHQLGVLKGGKRYLIFLRKDNGVDWFVITGYELFNNKVIPVDGQESKDPFSALPFAYYSNADEVDLLRDLQEVLKKGELNEK